jgi:acetylornithine deacetylase/succinyl-diaminopimelate desuccinylase-like protein
VMLLLKRNNVPLDRDVIFLAEAGEEGATRIGIEYVINQHFGAIDAEYCFAEGGGVNREGGAVRYASVQTVEKIPNGVDLIARGPAGHGSVPLMNQRDRSPIESGRCGDRLAAADRSQRHDGRLLLTIGPDFAAGAGAPLPGCADRRRQSRRCG